MSTSVRAVRFDDDSMWVDPDDGRRMAILLAWFPRLLAATPEQRSQFELSLRGIHWEALDEDVSIAPSTASFDANPPPRLNAR